MAPGSATCSAPGSTSASDSQTPPTNPRDHRRTPAPTPPSTPPGKRIVLARVGVSFVSVEDARANLAAEDPGLGFGTIAHRAAAQPGTARSAGSRSAAAPHRSQHLLHGALPRLHRAADLQRRKRRLPRDGRADPQRRRPHPVRGLLRLGHLPNRDPAALDPRPASAPTTWSARCSPTPNRAAACRAGPTPMGRA